MVTSHLSELIRNIQSHEIPFPLGTTSKEVFECAEAFVNAAGAKAIPCADDTKLTTLLHPYQDPKTKKFYIIGITGHPIEVVEPEELKQILHEGKHDVTNHAGLCHPSHPSRFCDTF